MDGFETFNRRFAHYILGNAPLEELATGFRWIEGLVWMGDAGCLLFQDLPRDRTMRWIEGAGVSVYRAPSGFANGQTRDRQGRLISCSHRERCLFRTELDGDVTRLVDRHDGKRLNSPNDVTAKSDGTIWFTDPLYGIQNDYEGGTPDSPSNRPRSIGSTRKAATSALSREISTARTASPSHRTKPVSMFRKRVIRRPTIPGNIFAYSMWLAMGR